MLKQSELIEMAKQAGANVHFSKRHIKFIEAFAELVAQHEREMCAKICAEDNVQAMDFTGGTFVGGYFSRKCIDRV